MNSRRSFLSLLGLGAVAAPGAAKALAHMSAAEAAAVTSPIGSHTHTAPVYSGAHAHTYTDPGHTHGITYLPIDGEQRMFFTGQIHGHGYEIATMEYRGGSWVRV